MRSVRAACGVAAVLLCLSGCGGSGNGVTSPSALASSSDATTVPTSSAPTPSATNRSATLSWQAPTTNSNGTALTDLAGYHIHYGTSASSLNQTIDVPNPGTSTYTVTGLTAGTWYFAITAYTTSGLESSLSNEGSKTIT